MLTVLQPLHTGEVDLFCDASWDWMTDSGFWLIEGLFVHVGNVISNAPEFKFSIPSVLPLLLFSSSRLTCFSILRMTKVSVLVLKKSETNCWISMRIWWLTVVNSLFWYNLCCCVYLGQWQLRRRNTFLALAYTARSQPITKRSQGQNPSKNLKKITGIMFADLLRFMLLDR